MIKGHASHATNEFGDDIVAGRRPPIPKDCPSALSKLIRACWAEDPNKRPSVEEIMNTLDEVLVITYHILVHVIC
jgi:hypothetical protein